MNKIFSIVCFCLFLFFIFSCEKENVKTIPGGINNEKYNFYIPKNFPTKLYIPEDNPLTSSGIELGRYLFYDGRLSGRTHPDSLMSCYSCHKQELSFEAGFHPKGITGISTPNEMLPMINLVWNPNTLLWNGKVKNIEDLVWMGVIAPHEMNGDTNRTRELIASIPMYAEMFKRAFGTEEITFKQISYAIAQFVRTLVSSDSKFDKYMRGEAKLTDTELNGYFLFTTEEGADCFHCHGGDGNPLFTTNLFYNNGKDDVFTDTRDRFSVTQNTKDIGAYKATTLRNISFTGPYMHDGRFKTIEEVVEFYNSGLKNSPYINPLMHKINDGGARLNDKQKNDLLAFLRSLNDSVFITNPAYSNPFKNKK